MVATTFAAAGIDEASVSPLLPMASNMLDQIGAENLPRLAPYSSRMSSTENAAGFASRLVNPHHAHTSKSGW